jgi:hypothetical protein
METADAENRHHRLIDGFNHGALGIEMICPCPPECVMRTLRQIFFWRGKPASIAVTTARKTSATRSPGRPRNGGHRAGTGKPGKSEFPSSWSNDKIKGEVSDVATGPGSVRTPQQGGRTKVQGTRDGVDITVIVEPGSKGGRIVTGFPTNTPRNP